MGQDSDSDAKTAPQPVAQRLWAARHGFTREQRKHLLASGMKAEDLDRAEAGMVANAAAAERHEDMVAGRKGATTTASRTSDDTLAPGQTRAPAYQGGAPATKNETMDQPMNSKGQAGGGVGRPGHSEAGLANIPIFKKLMSHGHRHGGQH